MSGRYKSIVDVLVLLHRPDGRVLLLRRAAPEYAGQLTIVGGHLKPGEPLDSAARREAGEEAGIRISADQQEFCGLVHHHQPAGTDRITAVFVAQSWAGEPFNAEPDKHEGLF
ncbi:NUDIX domain-containing protein [Streptomyces sp. NPDC058471]|uniref:NUDIX domain-containing protein n=1 Tax=Streptomyces sp. NPDC058471 TaxID=3346516 RepID=UPI00364DFC0C